MFQRLTKGAGYFLVGFYVIVSRVYRGFQMLSEAYIVLLSFWLCCFCGLASIIMTMFRQQVVAGFGVVPSERMGSYARVVGLCSLALWVIFAAGVELFLVLLPIGVALICAGDFLWRRYYGVGEDQSTEVVLFCRENLNLLLVIFFVRYFVIQHYRVPTGSLEPTVQTGDFILVNQFAYGWHVPVLNTKLLPYGQPKRGEIAVFRYPRDPYKLIYVKRVVGLPGDHIVYRDKRLVINGVEAPQEDAETTSEWLDRRHEWLAGLKHDIYVDDASYTEQDDVDIVVPEGHYFMMGDNRDNSSDSRSWGAVPESLLVGRGELILFGWTEWLPDFMRAGKWL